MVETPFSLQKISALPLPVSSVNLCSLLLPLSSVCQQTMDLFGDHSLCCKKSGDRITRHNNLRNLVFKLADTGLLAPELEKLGILGPTDKTRRRPGDVSMKDWSLHRGLALAASHLHTMEPCESYA